MQQLASMESMAQQDDDYAYMNQRGKKFKFDDGPASKAHSEFMGKSLYLSPIMMNPSEKNIPSYLIKSTSKVQIPNKKMKKDESDIVQPFTLGSETPGLSKYYVK